MFRSRTCTRLTRLVGWLLATVPEIFHKLGNAIFLTSPWSKDIKNDILNCRKYKYTGDAIVMYLQIWNYALLTHWLTFALYHQVYFNLFPGRRKVIFFKKVPAGKCQNVILSTHTCGAAKLHPRGKIQAAHHATRQRAKLHPAWENAEAFRYCCAEQVVHNGLAILFPKSLCKRRGDEVAKKCKDSDVASINVGQFCFLEKGKSFWL